MERCQAQLTGQHPPAFQGLVLPSSFWAALHLQGLSVAMKYPERRENPVCLHSPEENRLTKKKPQTILCHWEAAHRRAFLGSTFTVQFSVVV